MGRLNSFLIILLGLPSGVLFAAPPLPVSLNTADHCFFGRTIILTGTASDPDDNLDYLEFWARLRDQTPPASWQRFGSVDVSGGSAEAEITWTPPGVGDYEFYLGVFDEAGESHTGQPEGQRYQYAYVTVESPQPIPKAVKLPASAEANSTITIAATTFDPDGNLKEMSIYYRFNNGDLTLINENPIPVSGFYATAKVDWTPAQTGTYSVQARVEDHDGYRNDSSLGGAVYVVESVEVVRAGTSQGGAGGQSGGTGGGQSGGATGQSGGSDPSIRSVSVPEKVYRNEFNRISASVLDSDGDLDEVQFQYRYKASGTTQWGEWVNIGSAVEVSGSRDTASGSWKPTVDGDYAVQATVTDEAGNSASRENRGFEMRQGSPLVLSFTKPSTVYSHEANALSARVKDATDNLDDVQFQYSYYNSSTATWSNWANIGSAIEATSNHFFTARVNWTPTATGSHKIKVIVTDTSDNESPTYETAIFTVVSGPPVVVRVSTPSSVYNGESTTLSVRVRDPSGNLKEVQFAYSKRNSDETTWATPVNIGSAVSVSGGPGVVVTATKAWTPSATGTYKIVATVKDQSNNTDSGESSSFPVVNRPHPPVVVSVTPPSPAYQNESNTVSAEVSDADGDLSDVIFEYRWNAPVTGWTGWINIGFGTVSGSSDTPSISWRPTQIGTHQIKVTVTDQSTATSHGTGTSSTFTVVSGSPVVATVNPPSPAYQNEANTISAAVSDPSGNLSSVRFQYDGPAAGTTWVDIGSVSVSGSSATPSISWTPTLNGTHQIRVTATDASGNNGSRNSNNFQVSQRTPPPPVTVNLSISDSVYQNEYNYLTVRATDATGDLQQVQFQYDGPSAGTTWVDIGSAISVSGSADTAAVMWKPTVAGTYKIRATATDASTNTQSVISSSFTVTANTGTGSSGTEPPHMVQGPLTIGDNQTHDVVHGSDIATSGSVTIENGGQSIFWSGGKILLGDGFSADPSGEGFFNAIIDQDMDGLSDLEEGTLGTNPKKWDTDGDGFSDGWEKLFRLNPKVADDPSTWTDGDGDGMANFWETHYSFDLSRDNSLDDPDSDGYPNIYEYLYSTDPTDSSETPTASYTIGASGDYINIQAALNGASGEDLEYVVFKLIDDAYAGPGNANITLGDTAIRHFLIIADGGPSDSSIDIKAVQIIQGISVRQSDSLVPLVHLNKWRLLVDQYQL